MQECEVTGNGGRLIQGQRTQADHLQFMRARNPILIDEGRCRGSSQNRALLVALAVVTQLGGAGRFFAFMAAA